jgi:DNA processing protein
MDLRLAQRAAALADGLRTEVALKDQLMDAGSGARWASVRPCPATPAVPDLPGLRAYDWAAAGYPPAMRELIQPPPALFVRGRPDPPPIAPACVAVIGARRCTERGRWLAYDMARGLAEAGIVVVSGLAIGIDAAAHEGALAGGGPTVAVLASSVDKPTPQRNRALGEAIANGGGWLVSERPFGCQVRGREFPRRNRLVAAMVQAVVVVEAGLPSGTLGTVSIALDLDRDVAAVPGTPGAPASAGANALLKAGAPAVEDAGDVLSLIKRGVPNRFSPVERDEQAVLAALPGAVGGPGQWLAGSGLPRPRAEAALGRLLARGALRRLGGGRLARVLR